MKNKTVKDVHISIRSSDFLDEPDKVYVMDCNVYPNGFSSTSDYLVVGKNLQLTEDEAILYVAEFIKKKRKKENEIN
jgi:hypothetical protein